MAIAGQLILALGGEQSLVATDISSVEPKNLPRVGYHRALSAEGILSLAPTRLIGSDEMLMSRRPVPVRVE